MAHESTDPNPGIRVLGLEMTWQPERGTCTLAGLPVALLWIDSTLAHLLAGMQSMVGTERYALALQREGRNSVDADWALISRFADFSDGFRAIADVAAVAGWGRWELVDCNHVQKRAIFRSYENWEGLYQKALGVSWGSAMLGGKFAGYTGRLFGTNCWAEQTAFAAEGSPYDEFLVTPSERSVEEEIGKLLDANRATQADMAVALQKLRQEVQGRKKAEQQAHRLAYYDPLTGLANRRYLHEQLRHELDQARHEGRYGALLLIDLDHFKNLNDSLGHSIGDQLLAQVSRRIKRMTRAGDTVARLGGDEFVLLLPHLSTERDEAVRQVRMIAAKFDKVLEECFRLEHYEHHITASIGVRLFRDERHNDIETPIKQADIALYRAKQKGRNTLCFYDEAMQSAADSRLQIEAALRNAIGEHSLYLLYQPQVDADGRLHGLEALLRWSNPLFDKMPINETIEIAEQTGMIIAIGDWVMRQALARLHTWSAAGLPEHFSHVSINVSPRQFCHPEFVPKVQTMIEAAGVSPQRVTLEITENLLLENADLVIESAHELKRIGVRLSLDDFGTGYSSLAYLRMLPLDELKIDRSFVIRLLDDHGDRVIVDTILAMASNLGLAVVVEGVEGREQLDYLVEKGCAVFQGYYFSRPAAPEALSAYGLGSPT